MSRSLKLFSIFDDKAKAFIAPFALPEFAQATRAFAQGMTDEKSELSKSPMDYSLFYIGSFDPLAGTVEATVPECIMTGVEALSTARRVAEQLALQLSRSSKE